MAMRKLRVMHVIIGNGFGGLEKVVCDLLTSVDRKKIESYLLCLSEPNILKERFESTGAKVISLGHGRGLNLGCLKEIRDILLKCKVDIVHCHDFQPFFYTALATLGLRGLGKVFTEHSSVYSVEARHRLFLRFFSRTFDRCILVSKELQEFYRNRISLHGRRYCVINNGVRIPEAVNGTVQNEYRRQLGLEGKIVIGTAVRLIEQKGLGYFVDSIPKVISRCPEARFLIIGDGRLKRRLEEQVESLGVGGNVKFLGYRNDVTNLLSVIDIYVLPSLWEGFPLGLIEAMLSGKQIVATSVGGVPELLSNEETGLLVEPGNPETLAEAVIRLIQDPSLGAEMAGKAKRQAEAKYALDVMVATYQDCYEEVRREKK